uniref:PX domain-containing protein n=1 Tax=Ditylenchus dipsaci TaxID=166011 RepID=A0A915CUY7_9BILA
MTTLLPDETYCKTDLGSMLYKIAKSTVITATPHNSLNYEPRHYELTSRFKELNRLYTQLSTIHRQLHLKDTFPNFVEAKLFGSASQEAIQERRRAIDTFLNFVLKNEVMCKTRVFQTFIEGAKEKPKEEPEKFSTALVPDVLTVETPVITTDLPAENTESVAETKKTDDDSKRDSLD